LATISISTSRSSTVVVWSSSALGGAAFACYSRAPEPTPEQPARITASTNTMEAVLPTHAASEAAVFGIYPSP
jgi:hypothetical protein